jgi:hypothetical protein
VLPHITLVTMLASERNSWSLCGLFGLGEICLSTDLPELKRLFSLFEESSPFQLT